MRRILNCGCAVVVLAAMLMYTGGATAGETGLKELQVGSKAPAFTLKSTEGKSVSLKDILASAETRAVVIQFISTRCPVSRAYDARMAKLHEMYSKRHVQFVGINSNSFPEKGNEGIDEIKAHAEQNKLSYPILKDADSGVANAYGAMTTPHIFLLDRSGIVRYVGSIDDSQKPENIKQHYLTDALDAVLAGKEVQTKHTKAFGCAIKRGKIEMSAAQ